MIGIYIGIKTYFATSNVNFDKLNWSAVSVVVAAVAVIISLVSLYLQRKDIEKQSKYQRSTFELQNKIEENNLLLEISSEMLSNVQGQLQYLTRIYISKYGVMQLESFRSIDKTKEDQEKIDLVLEDTKSNLKIFLDSQRRLSENFSRLTSILNLRLTNYEQKSDVCKMMKKMTDKLNNINNEIDQISRDGDFKSEKEIKKWEQDKSKEFDIIFEPFQKVFINLKKDLERKVTQITKDDF